MTNPRYEVKLVHPHGGRRVVHVYDSVKQETLMVYRRGNRYLLWNKQDVRVGNAALRRVVREALENEVSRG